MAEALKPAIFIGFDRPDLGQVCLKPLLDLPKLYLFCDGPTENVPSTQKEYKIIFDKIKKQRRSLPTEIWTPHNNHGPLHGPPSAFFWMLEKEKRGTIVEEDVLTTPAFHAYASWALDTFENQEDIIALSSGVPSAFEHLNSPFSKSNLFLVWGWASWYNKIKNIKFPDPDITPHFPKLGLLKRLHYQRLYRTLISNPHYAWSPYIQFYLLKNNKSIIFPKYKTTQNIGISPTARRTKGQADTPPEPLPENLRLSSFLPHLSQREELLIFKKKNGGWYKELRVRLAIRSKAAKLKRLLSLKNLS